MQSADSRSLATFLLCRDIQDRRKKLNQQQVAAATTWNGVQAAGRRAVEGLLQDPRRRSRNCVLISEILDPRTRSLISVANISDYVMSNEIISAAVAQVSEQREINTVLTELLSAEGNETYVRSIRIYCTPTENVSFWDLAKRARTRKEIAIGFKLESEDKPVLNPENKSEPRRWKDDDQLIVISCD